MNFHKLVNFEELLLPSEHSSAQVSWTYVSTICGYKMPVAGGTSAATVFELIVIAFLNMSRLPYVVLLLATRWLYWGYILLSTAFSIAFFRMSR